MNNVASNPAPSHTQGGRRHAIGWLDGALTLTAAALLGLAIVQVASTSTLQPLAQASENDRAGMLSTIGEYTLLSVNVGNDDAMAVLDARAEEIVVYRADNQQAMQIIQRMSLPRMFTEARGRSGVHQATEGNANGQAPHEPRNNPPR